ncbi:MAG: MarR family transcriptional regulator [Planctomycetes bacterium]|nr:MarR family transcriptional regulator [Planctomycetota bacterium]
MKPLQLLSPIHRATRQIDLHLAEKIKAFGVNTAEGHLLTYLLSYAPCVVSELYRVFGLKPSTVTSMLDRLENQPFLERKPHPKDRRSWVITLTPKGKNLALKLRQMIEQLEEDVLKQLKPNQLKGFHAVMDAVAQTTKQQVRP